MSEIELKPCPFCGESNATICETDFTPEHRKAYCVACRTRDCHGAIFLLGYGLHETIPAAIAAWNTRLRLSPDRAAIIEELRSLVAALSDALTDEGPDGGWSNDGLHRLRVRVAKALPPGTRPEWLDQYAEDAAIRALAKEG